MNDWALVRLDSSMAVAPYQIADGLGEAVAENTKVVSVVHSQDYLVLNPEGGTLHPKTVSECTVRDLLNRAGRLVYFHFRLRRRTAILGRLGVKRHP